MTTEYIAATTPDEYKRAQNFLRKQFPKGMKLTFPTIMAMRDNDIVGLLGTRPSNRAIIAGPMINPTESPFIYLNLVEAYERVLKLAGIKEYLFNIKDDETDYLSQMFRGAHLTPYEHKNGYYWFRKEV